jgi:hypothetical protein
MSAVVFALGCFLAGYAVAGYRVSASADDVAVRSLPGRTNIGDSVTLSFEAGAVASGMTEVTCEITGLSGIWVRCASPGKSPDSSREQLWYDTTRVAVVKKTER